MVHRFHSSIKTTEYDPSTLNYRDQSRSAAVLQHQSVPLVPSVRDTQQTWDFDGLTLEPKFSTLLQTVSV